MALRNLQRLRLFSGRHLSSGVPLADKFTKKHVEQSKILPPFFITDSTLREGEQYATCSFTTEDRIYIAKQLDHLGADYIELVNPIVSSTAMIEAQRISALNLQAKIAVHIRCAELDVHGAIASGADAVNMYMATSDVLRSASHGKDIDAVIDVATHIVGIAAEHGLEVRFSCEDAFRSDIDDILRVYEAVVDHGAHRVGLADTVGIATPREVTEVTQKVRAVVGPDVGINFHTHNDSGCCIANALLALEAGATHIDTSVLGIGERNGITPLGGFLARLYTIDPDYIKNRFKISVLGHLDRYVADSIGEEIPFNNYITGSAAYSHKAGVHSKAVVANPGSYEVIDPQDFGVRRTIHVAHHLVGWNAVANRAVELGLSISEEIAKKITLKIKEISSTENLSAEQFDHVLRKIGKLPKVELPSGIDDEETSEEIREELKRIRDSMENMMDVAVEQAVMSMPRAPPNEDVLAKVVQIQGHLFDHTVVNKVMDLCVDSPCKFKVLTLDIPNSNEELTNCRIRFLADKQEDLDDVMLEIVKTTEAVPSAQCTVAWESDELSK